MGRSEGTLPPSYPAHEKKPTSSRPQVLLAVVLMWRSYSSEKDMIREGTVWMSESCLGLSNQKFITCHLGEKACSAHQTFSLPFTQPRATSALPAPGTTCAYTALAFCPGFSFQEGGRQETPTLNLTDTVKATPNHGLLNPSFTALLHPLGGVMHAEVQGKKASCQL